MRSSILGGNYHQVTSILFCFSSFLICLVSYAQCIAHIHRTCNHFSTESCAAQQFTLRKSFRTKISDIRPIKTPTVNVIITNFHLQSSFIVHRIHNILQCTMHTNAIQNWIDRSIDSVNKSRGVNQNWNVGRTVYVLHA